MPLSREDAAALAKLQPGQSKVIRTETELRQYHVFGSPWEVAIAAHEMRYPTHPDLPLMVSSEVVSRDSSQESEGKEIFTRRAVIRASAVPRMLNALAGGDTMEFEETYEYDRASRRAYKTGKNLSFREGGWGIKLDETMEYVTHAANADWTWFRLEARLTLPSLPGGLGGTAEKMFADLYIDGVGRGRVIDQNFIDEIYQSGTERELVPWAQEGEGEEAAWDSGTETELTSYEDADEGPHDRSALPRSPSFARTAAEAPPSADLAAVVSELRALTEALVEVSWRLDMMGMPGVAASGEASPAVKSAEAEATKAAEEAHAAVSSARVWRRVFAVAVLGAGAVGVLNWRQGSGGQSAAVRPS